MNLVSIKQAAAQGVQRLRKPVWADPLAHLQLDIIDGKPGPWLHLFDPCNKAVNGRDPVDVLFLQFDFDAEEWLAYEGPTAESVEYAAARARFAQ